MYNVIPSRRLLGSFIAGGLACLSITLPCLVPAQNAPAPPAALTITTEAGARQTFCGLGASIFPWTTAALYKTQVTPEQNAQMARLLWHDAHFRSARLWMHPTDCDPALGKNGVGFYVNGYFHSGKLPAAIKAGLKDMILAPNEIPDHMGDGHGFIQDTEIANYASILADFIRDFKAQTGILINYAGILNEPNDRPVKFRDAQWPVMIKAFRRVLDQRGLRAVKIIAPESANCGADAYATVDAIHADAQAWNALNGVATHSYNNAATADMAKRAVGKEYWITEAGGTFDGDEDAGNALQAASAASRFLNDINHGVTHWMFFIGAEQADPRGNTGRILKFDLNPYRLTVLQKYYYWKQISETFDVGAILRHSTSDLDGEMTYTYGKKPHCNAAVARNPDGTWGIGLSNYTAPEFGDADDPKDFALHNSGYLAQNYAVTVKIAELAKIKELRFAMRRSNSGVGDAEIGTLVMRYGEITVPNAGPLDLITLRSIKSKTAGR